jgi:hypothetical protein
MRKNINTETIIGRVYQHDLKVKTVQNQNSDNFGKEFISGSLDVATDEDGLNVLTVHYTYVTETTKTGKKNSTYTALKKIIDEGKAWVVDGKDAATKVKVDTALALNDFYAQDDTLVSVKRNEGGFVTLVNELADISERNTFSVDMVITSVTKIEPTEENNVKEAYVSVRGAVFNFRNDLLPVDFVVRNAAGMKYFEDLDITSSEPVYTKVWGKIISMTDAREIKEESAFGEASVRTVERKTKEWVITGTAKVPYDFGDEEVLTADELTKAMQDREVHLAEVKKRSEEYRASKASSTPAAASASAPVAAKGNFSF